MIPTSVITQRLILVQPCHHPCTPVLLFPHIVTHAPRRKCCVLGLSPDALLVNNQHLWRAGHVVAVSVRYARLRKSVTLATVRRKDCVSTRKCRKTSLR